MPRNGKVKVSLVIALVTLAVLVVGGAWAYTLRNGERVAVVETRVDHLEEAVTKIDNTLDDGFKAILDAIGGSNHAGRSPQAGQPLGNLREVDGQARGVVGVEGEG